MIARITSKGIPQWGYKAMLLSAAIIWGLGFVVMKDALNVIPPAYLLGVRFAGTAIVLFLVFFRRVKANFNLNHILRGSLLGVFLYLAFWAQTIGLDYTMPGKNAFLTATYCVLVPFIFWAMARKRPTKFNIIAAFLCVFGIGMVSLQDTLTIEIGDAFSLVGAVMFAVQMAYVAKVAPRRDMLAMTVWQFVAAGICGFICGGAFETFPPLPQMTELPFLIDMGYLILFSSCLALVFQNVALAKVPPSQGSLFLSLESVFGVVFSVMLYGESLSLRLLAGFITIFAAIVISETFPLKGLPWRKKEKTT